MGSGRGKQFLRYVIWLIIVFALMIYIAPKAS